MAATHETRIARLKRLEALLAPGRAADACPDGARLLKILGEDYAGKAPEARRRALQRDLAAAGRGIRPVPNVYSVADRWHEPASPEKTFRTGRMPRPAF